ncbi:hypothetical protein HPB52_005523 [Rhipicephalus sanguineus]|uniref:Uncharacterized protein n=1 Tax=Rhipicephalus sanguineus TaxID=34632 RepID=A0A9D4QHF0_RHISA|nr:hypothetical protein HPB52_005523 [Rhipicephalus sanguineus]
MSGGLTAVLRLGDRLVGSASSCRDRSACSPLNEGKLGLAATGSSRKAPKGLRGPGVPGVSAGTRLTLPELDDTRVPRLVCEAPSDISGVATTDRRNERRSGVSASD